MITTNSKWPCGQRGFTLTEAVIAVIILGILVGIGIPIYIGIKRAAQDQAAISGAQTLNQAVSTYKWRVQNSDASFSSAANDNAKYALIQPYMPFKDSYPSLASFTPSGYSYSFGATIDTKVSVTGPKGALLY